MKSLPVKKSLLFVAALSTAALLGTIEAGAAGAPPVAGFNTENVDAFAGALSNELSNDKNVAFAAERMRAGLSLNPEQFAKNLSGLEQTAINGGFGRISSRSGPYLSWFFRGAVKHVESDRLVPVVTYYNPLVDIAAVSTWRRIDGVWRVTAISVIDGATLRGENSASPWWTVAGKPYTDAITQASAASIAGAHAWGARGLPSKVLGFNAMNARLSTMVAGLANLVADKSRAEAANRVRVALATATPATVGLSGVNGPTAEQMSTLSPDVRRTLAIVTAFDRAGGKSVALSSPLRPDLVFFADFTDGANPKGVSAVQIDSAT